MVAANGARFHVAVLGTGPLVLLLHGFPEFWWTWRHQLKALAAAGYRAAAMDLRGYGASDKPPRGYDPMTLAADASGVIRSLGERDAVVVGHGLGGHVAWTTAVISPSQVRRVAVLSAPHPLRLRSALLDPRQHLRATAVVLGFQRPVLPERKLVAHDGAEVGRLLRLWGGPGWPDEQVESCYRHAFQIAGTAHCALESYRWAVRSIPRTDGVRFARRMRTPVTRPTLHLHGALDRAVLPTSAEGSGRFVDAPYRWRLMDGVGHFPHEEAAEAVNRELLDWLADPQAGEAARKAAS